MIGDERSSFVINIVLFCLAVIFYKHSSIGRTAGPNPVDCGSSPYAYVQGALTFDNQRKEEHLLTRVLPLALINWHPFNGCFFVWRKNR